MKILLSILVYNNEFSKCKTYISLKNAGCTFDILCLDNSTIETNNEKFCNEKSIFYLSNDGNIGLPRAYNKIIEFFPNFDFYITLDDDTLLTNDFFVEINNTNFQGIDIFFPKIINGGGKKVSPTYSNKYGDFPFPINSGTAYSNSVLKNYKFNESLFMYFVDFDYFLNIKNSDDNIVYYELNTTIKHDISDLENYSRSTFKSMILRMQDAKIYFSKMNYLKYKLLYCFSRYKIFREALILLFFFKPITRR